MADQYTKAEWAAIQAGRAMAAAYQPGFNAAFPPRPVTTQPAGKRGDVGAPGQRGAPGATVYAATPTPVGSRTPVYTRGARTTEEQLAMVQSGNPAAMSLQQYGRAASNLAKSRSQMKDRGDTTFYSGYGEDRFRLSNAIRAPDATGFVSDGGTDAPDANFDRMAPYLAKDTAGRELAASYGAAVKEEKARMQGVKSTFDPMQYDSIEAAQEALAKDSKMAVRGFSAREAARLLSPEDRATIQANSMAKRLTEESKKYTPEGAVSPVFTAGPGGKIEVINGQAISEDVAKRAGEAVRRNTPKGWTYYQESTTDGKIVHKVQPPPQDGRELSSERHRQEAWSLITGRDFKAHDAASHTNVLQRAGIIAGRYNIVGEAPDGKVSVDRTEVDASLIGSLAKTAHQLMVNGDETDNAEALSKAIELVAIERGESAEKLAKRLGGTPNSFEDTLLTVNGELYKLLEVDAAQRDAEAAESAQAYKDGFKEQLTGPAAGELVAGKLQALRGAALMGNPYVKDAVSKIAEARSTPALARSMAESFAAMGTNAGRFEDATTAAMVREFEMVANGEPGADPELVKALDAARMQFTKWGEGQIEAIREKASGNPFLQQQVRAGAMVHDEKSGFFMPPALASQLASIQDNELRNDVLAAIPRDATGSIVGYTVGNPDFVGGKPTNPAFNVDEANAGLRKASIMAQGAASLNGLSSMKWTDLGGNMVDSPFTPTTVENIRAGVTADMAAMTEAGGTKKFDFKESKLPPAVKESLMKDPQLLQLYASGDAARMQAAASGAAADAWRTLHLSVASEVNKSFSGLVVAAEESGIIEPGVAAVLAGEASNSGGYTAGVATMAINTVETALLKMQKDNPAAFEAAKNAWNEHNAFVDWFQDFTDSSPGDQRAKFGRGIGMAKDANRKIRNQLGSNAYGIDDASIDRILSAKEAIDKIFNIDEITPAPYAFPSPIPGVPVSN